MDPLTAIMRRYSYSYSAAHDFSVCDQIMVDEYTLIMGHHNVAGREEAYKPATASLYEQYPTLCLSQHEFLTNGTRCAKRFSEHGCQLSSGRFTGWAGVSLYRWNGTKLTECRVEQDYYSRRRQLETGEPDPLEPNGHDPWAVPVEEEDPAVTKSLVTWLVDSPLLEQPDVVLDAEHVGHRERPSLEDCRVEVLDAFTAGSRGAFHIRLVGTYAGGVRYGEPGDAADLYVAGFAELRDGAVTSVRGVTDRLAMERRMKQGIVRPFDAGVTVV